MICFELMTCYIDTLYCDICKFESVFTCIVENYDADRYCVLSSSCSVATLNCECFLRNVSLYVLLSLI